jgi:hypothetical protein
MKDLRLDIDHPEHKLVINEWLNANMKRNFLDVTTWDELKTIIMEKYGEINWNYIAILVRDFINKKSAIQYDASHWHKLKKGDEVAIKKEIALFGDSIRCSYQDDYVKREFESDKFLNLFAMYLAYMNHFDELAGIYIPKRGVSNVGAASTSATSSAVSAASAVSISTTTPAILGGITITTHMSNQSTSTLVIILLILLILLFFLIYVICSKAEQHPLLYNDDRSICQN